MKFGRLSDISEVDFTLPPDAPGSAAVFARLPLPESVNLYVGCTGWSMKEWVGKTYPAGAKTKDYLQYYGQQFNTIELNTTHYRIPTPETVRKWYADTPADFRFCPKIPQSISHRLHLGLEDANLRMFCEAIVELREKAGCCFMQMPPFFAPDRLPALELFLQNFPADIPLAVELRHAAWFEHGGAEFERAARILEKYHRTAVITDVAGRRDVLHQRVTNHTVMIRWNGNGLVPTDFTRLDAWLHRLREWTEQGISEIYLFTHEPDNVLAPEAVDYTVRRAREILVCETRGPVFHKKDKSEQMSLF